MNPKVNLCSVWAWYLAPHSAMSSNLYQKNGLQNKDKGKTSYQSYKFLYFSVISTWSFSFHLPQRVFETERRAK